MPNLELEKEKIYYRHCGDGIPLLMIHGWGVSGAFWLDTIEGMISKYQCLVPDLPGFGRSSKPKSGYSIENYAFLMKSFMDKLGIDRFYLIGHSMGGIIAMHLACLIPQRIEKMVITNSLVYGRRAFWLPLTWVGDPTIAHIIYWISQKHSITNKGGWRLSSKKPLPSIVIQEILMGSVDAWRGCAKALWSLDIREEIKKINIPTLVVSATQDRLIRPVHSSLPSKLIPEAKSVWFDDTGHCTPVESPARFNKIVLDFFE